MIASKTIKRKVVPPTPVGKALARAAKDARKTARMYGTPIYISKNGKIIAVKP